MAQKFTQQANVRLTPNQFKQCLENGGVSFYVRWLIDQDIVVRKCKVESNLVRKVMEEKRIECGY